MNKKRFAETSKFSGSKKLERKLKKSDKGFKNFKNAFICGKYKQKKPKVIKRKKRRTKRQPEVVAEERIPAKEF